MERIGQLRHHDGRCGPEHVLIEVVNRGHEPGNSDRSAGVHVSVPSAQSLVNTRLPNIKLPNIKLPSIKPEPQVLPLKSPYISGSCLWQSSPWRRCRYRD